MVLKVLVSFRHDIRVMVEYSKAMYVVYMVPREMSKTVFGVKRDLAYSDGHG